jgi:hypothetical protein
MPCSNLDFLGLERPDEVLDKLFSTAPFCHNDELKNFLSQATRYVNAMELEG